MGHLVIFSGQLWLSRCRRLCHLCRGDCGYFYSKISHYVFKEQIVWIHHLNPFSLLKLNLNLCSLLRSNFTSSFSVLIHPADGNSFTKQKQRFRKSMSWSWKYLIEYLYVGWIWSCCQFSDLGWTVPFSPLSVLIDTSRQLSFRWLVLMCFLFS